MNVRTRAVLVGLGVAVPFIAGVQITHAAPQDEGKERPQVQRPSAMDEISPSKPAQPEPDAGPAEDEARETAPEAGPSPPAETPAPAEGGPPVDLPEAPADTAPAAERPEPQRPEKMQEPPAKKMLAPSHAPTTAAPPARRVPTKREQSERDAQALARALRHEYRPESNPVRFNLIASGFYTAAASTDASISGRLGGATLEPGMSWNYVGPAITLTAMGGRLLLPTEQGTEIRALLGAGPTIGLGRLALIRRGFLDLRIGYDFFHAKVSAREGVVTGEDGLPPESVDESDLAPHGPRLRLAMGLLASPQVPRRFWHGFGFNVGYQTLVGSLRGDLPVIHMLTIGLVYFAGDKPAARARTGRTADRRTNHAARI